PARRGASKYTVPTARKGTFTMAPKSQQVRKTPGVQPRRTPCAVPTVATPNIKTDAADAIWCGQPRARHWRRSRDATTAPTPRELARREGLTITAIHAPMLVVTRRVWGPNFFNIIERSVDLAQDLGSKIVVIHPPFLWELKYQAWLLGELDHYSTARGVDIAV